MKDEILEQKMDRMLERLRLEENDRRNRALEARMATPRTAEEMLALLAAMEGLRPRRRAEAQISQKDAYIV